MTLRHRAFTKEAKASKPMIISVQTCPTSGRSVVFEKGFRYDFPAPIAAELIRYLDGRNCDMQEFSMGEWVLSLPFGKRMSVSIQLTNNRIK